jgi:hypothetical protein
MNPMAQATAQRLINEFGKKPLPGAFPHLDRSEIASGLAKRVVDPTLINQGRADLCAPASLVYDLARTRVVEYVNAVTGLFDRGSTRIGDLLVEPCNDLRFYKPPTGSIEQVDWIIIASIRDSENWLWDYESVDDRGGTNPPELTSWLKKAGYTDLKEDWNNVLNKTAANLKEADELYSKNYHVFLRVDANVLEGKKVRLSQPNHRVVLASRVTTNWSPTSSVTMDVYTWGAIHTLPKDPMILDDFLDYYYGYVAARF